MSLRAWLEANASKSTRLGRRVIEGLREVGVLLIAFAPLESALRGPDPVYHARFLIEFGGGGLLLFAMSLALEWRFDDAE
jgi:hypothetical protein